MDTDIENSISVHVNGSTTKFYQCQDGLYFHNPSNMQVNNNNSHTNKNKSPIISYPVGANNHLSFLNTVHKNKQIYNKKEIKMADEALNLLQCLGYPSITNFKEYLNRNLLSNSHITAVDVDRAVQIYGVPAPLLKGKKVAPTQTSARGYQTELHPMITGNLTNLQLFIDIFYVNGLAFLNTKTQNQNARRHLNYITINHLKNKKAATIIIHLKRILRRLRTRNFKVAVIHGDNEFNVDSIKDT